VNLPRDAALPGLGLLLDPEAMAPQLAGSLGRPAQLDGLRIARIAYKPGTRALVHYEVTVDGRAEDAVAGAVAGRDLSARARHPRLLALAQRVNGRSPAAFPLSYLPAADALVTWLPFDLRLPALAEPPRRLAELLQQEGVTSVAPTGNEPTVVQQSYKPSTRIVLHFGRHVLKAYGKDDAYRRGVLGMRIAARMPLRTPGLEGCLPDLRLTAQPAVDGVAPTPVAAAATAGELARRLQSAPVSLPDARRPDSLLTLAADKATLAARLVPELGPRLGRLLTRLGDSAPAVSALVPAHGDLDADQLVVTPAGEHVVLDFDDVCLAAPALDLAAYLADVVRGDGDDLAAIDAVEGPLLDGYGGRPPALGWYLAAVVLARAPHPFQRADPAWPERVKGTVRTAEEVLAP
jgi:Phosphotransferase enzyme family